MALESLRPNATIANTGTLIGAANAHTALSDDSDLSYVGLDSSADILTVAFDDLGLPAGAEIKSLGLRVRTRRDSGSPQLSGSVSIDPAVAGLAVVTWLSPTGLTLETQAVAYSDAAVDAAQATFSLLSGPAAACRVIEVYLDVIYLPLPVVDVTSPSGAITEDTAPTVEWTPTLDADGGSQTHFEVKVFADGTYGGGGFDPDTSIPSVGSGEVASGATSWEFDETLPDDTYRFYVRIVQTVNGELRRSAWTYEECTVDVDLPAVPTLTLTPQSGDARILVEVEAGVGGAVTTDLFEVQRSNNGGATWQAVRTNLDEPGILAPVGGEAFVHDYEAPNGEEAQFRARALHSYADSRSASAWAQDDATWSSTVWWIKHGTKPELNLAVTPRSQPSRQRKARRGVLEPLEREHPVVVSGKRGGWTGQLVLRIDTDGDRDAVLTLLNESVPLLVQAPAAEYWEDAWLSFGDQDQVRAIDAAWGAITFDALDWNEVDRPDGPLESSGSLVLI